MTSTETRSDLNSLLRLALPIAAVNLGWQAMGLVDTAVAGRVDALTLAATGLGNSVISIAQVGGLGVILGIDPLASQAIGAGQPREARRTLWAGIHLALLLSLPLMLLTWGCGQALELAGIQPDLASRARAYLNPRLLQLPPFLVFIALRSYLQALQRTAPLLLAIVVANLFNLAADWALVFGVPSLGIPPMGVAGLAWATNAATLLQLGILAWGVGRIAPGDGPEPLRRPDPALLRRAFGIGFPLGLQLLAEVGIFSIVGLLVGRMGVVQMAAHQLALTVASLTFMVPLGISMAASTLVGNAIGRGDTPAARRAGLLGIGLGAAFMLLMGLGLWTLPGPVARLLTSDAAVIPAAAGLLAIAGAFQLFDGIQSCACGALRGAGVTRWAFGANVAGYWLLGLPFGLWLAHRAGLGPRGLWWGLTAGLALVSIAVAAKFERLSRRTIQRL